MLIRRNTKAFKTIQEIVSACHDRSDREQLIRLYITKAGNSINDRLSVEGIEVEAGVFYDMTYQTVMNNLKSSSHQLYHSDDIPGIYFFHRSSNKSWDETPFEFDEAIKKEFSSLPELPVFRKKEKAEKVAFPTPKLKVEPPKPVKREKAEKTKVIKSNEKEQKGPDYRLNHKIDFTHLEKIIVRSAQMTKKHVLDYYDKISDYILPYLKDRPQLVRLYSDSTRATVYMSLKSLTENNTERIPAWIQTALNLSSKDKERLLLCNDREHLLLYAELGCVGFHPCHSHIKNLESPDYIIIGVESPESDLSKAINVVHAAKDILTGLQLPSFVKSDGVSGLHIYIPLDAKSGFETSKNVGEYICKLIRLKIPDLVSVKGSEGNTYRKVALDYLLNKRLESVIAPYSLVPGQANVATPLLWEEVNEGLRMEDFNHETIFKRLKQVGDPFRDLFKKKVNADDLLGRMQASYSFLF